MTRPTTHPVACMCTACLGSRYLAPRPAKAPTSPRTWAIRALGALALGYLALTALAPGQVHSGALVTPDGQAITGPMARPADALGIDVLDLACGRKSCD